MESNGGFDARRYLRWRMEWSNGESTGYFATRAAEDWVDADYDWSGDKEVEIPRGGTDAVRYQS